VLLRDILLMAYGALTLQSVQLNPGDAAGVMNPAASDWWIHNLHRLPLTREPFISRPKEHP
jgi:hypothetical protein